MKFMGAAKALVDKGKEAASKNADKIENAIDKTGRVCRSQDRWKTDQPDPEGCACGKESDSSEEVATLFALPPDCSLVSTPYD